MRLFVFAFPYLSFYARLMLDLFRPLTPRFLHDFHRSENLRASALRHSRPPGWHSTPALAGPGGLKTLSRMPRNVSRKSSYLRPGLQMV